MKVLLIGIAVLVFLTSTFCDGSPEDRAIVEEYFECFERQFYNSSEEDFMLYCEGFDVEYDYDAVYEVS